jgi:3-methyladenine DNA glycosylase AlkD
LATTDLRTLRARLRALANPDIAAHSRRFFKTAPGEYGHRDRFLGIRVPTLRAVAREARGAPLKIKLALLRSPYHEERLVALLLLVYAFARGDAAQRESIYAAYLAHVPKHVNNWDLVDCSAHEIVGAHLEQRDRGVLYDLARAPHLWSRRVAILATLWFIRRRTFDDTLAVAEILLDDREDLIHKAVGWMLREVGNRDRAALERFLRRHYRRMPRTMLRYAIEKFPEPLRGKYLRGEVTVTPSRRYRGGPSTADRRSASRGSNAR